MNVVWILGDQLDARWPRWLADAGLTPADTQLLLIESDAKLRSRPWHRHKLTLVLSAMRHFAGYLRGQGWSVAYEEAPDFATGLHRHLGGQNVMGRMGIGIAERLYVMRPSTWTGAQFIEALTGRIATPVAVWPNRMFLAQPSDLGTAKKPLLENFYRTMRKRTGLLMDGAQPAGGAWNHDADNRQPPRKHWRSGNSGDIPALPAISPDVMTRAVIEKVRTINSAWGALEGFALPVTHASAQDFFETFLRERLPLFGPYEDAMVPGQATLFHSLISPLLNIGLLNRDDICAAAEAEYRAGRAPINSVEGFVRQILGWREFVYACYWREMPGLAKANALDARAALPAFYWNPGETASPLRVMACLRESAQSVWGTGYTHHIQRLMVLSNFALLAGVRPQQLNEWFLCTYIDAYDWVVTPNVIGMGSYGDGGVVGTKPYAAGANYLHKMGAYCEVCLFDPKVRIGPRACPFNALYWDFIARHAELLARNPRTSMPVNALRKMNPDDVNALRAQARQFLEAAAIAT